MAHAGVESIDGRDTCKRVIHDRTTCKDPRSRVGPKLDPRSPHDLQQLLDGKRRLADGYYVHAHLRKQDDRIAFGLLE